MVARVGLVINPDAGKDIRRLLSLASYVSNFTKVELGKRVIAGLDAAGVDEVLIMHDNCGLGEDVLTMMSGSVAAALRLVETRGTGTALDTDFAVRRMVEAGVRAIVLIGGDGTLRTAFRVCGASVPLACVAAGTNNVTGAHFDATLVGYAAGLVATGRVGSECLRRTKSLEVIVNGKPVDRAVIDVVVTSTPYVGARAIFNADSLLYAVFSKGEPTDVGLASVLGFVRPVTFESDEGYFIEFGDGGYEVKAVVMPGVIKTVRIRSFKRLCLGESVELPRGTYAVALDGERELEVTSGDTVSVKLLRDGPLLINVSKALYNVGTLSG